MSPAERKRILEQWRGVSTPEPMRHNAKVIGDVLPNLMKELGLTDRYAEEEMARVWTQIVGHPLCLQAVPIKIKREILTVRMIQPTIHFVLQSMRDEILTKLQERFGKQRIRGVKFVVN
mgnify:CR=1 FL=1|jgi:predicted nucleic acid-binding Zn ribbon protein